MEEKFRNSSILLEKHAQQLSDTYSNFHSEIIPILPPRETKSSTHDTSKPRPILSDPEKTKIVDLLLNSEIVIATRDLRHSVREKMRWKRDRI